MKKPEKILHTHDSIPSYTSGLEDGCIVCVRNKAIADCEEYYKEEVKRIKEISERVAVITAHRVCCGSEHDPANAKLHGYCIVCGVPFPCEYAGKPKAISERLGREEQ